MHFGSFLLIFVVLIKASLANRFNVSYAELQFCKEYDVKAGYKYSTFFHIESMKPNRVRTDKDDTLLNLKIFVLASKDAHILLSPTDQIKSSPIYEIVLGAGGNTFNEIRRQRQTQPLKTVRVKNFLSATDVMPLTVHISNQGNISVAITGQPPFISAVDPNVLDVKYLSFSTWGTAEGKWFYDCEIDDNVNDDRLAPIQQNGTNSEKLSWDLLAEYDTLSEPFGLREVMLNFDLTKVQFDTRKAFMISRGRFRLSWVDQKLTWNESQYEIHRLNFQTVLPYQKIWTPKLRLLNGVDSNFVLLPLVYMVSLYPNGTVLAESDVNTFTTWCANENGKWPYESVNCDLQIQMDSEKGKLLLLHNDFRNLPQATRLKDVDHSDWRIVSLDLTAVEDSSSIFNTFVDSNRLWKSNHMLKIDVGMQRNSIFHSKLLAVPLDGAFVLLLISFWVDRPIRVAMNALSIVSLIGMLLIFADLGPANNTPTIVIYYVSSLFLVCASLASLIVQCHFAEQKPNYEWLLKVTALYLQLLGSHEYEDIEESSATDFSKVLDHILFIVFLIIFIVCTVIGC